MKKLLLIIVNFLCFVNLANGADLYKIDPMHANVNWSANHFGFSSPSGKFSDVDGKIIIDERNPQNSSVEVVIKTNSITTGFAKFDTHLKSADFFNVEKFPIALFKSTSIRASGSSGAKVTGLLTIKENSKSITLDVKINKIGKNPITQNKTIGMTISGKIKRSLFGINYGIPGISDEVSLQIECEAIYQGENNQTNNSDSAWQIIDNKSKIEFEATQSGSKVNGSFKKFTGKINFDPNTLDKNSVEIEVDTSSIEIPFLEAVETAKSVGWLATATYPKAIFKSSNFVAMPGKNNFSAKGILQLKGKDVPIVLNFNLKAITERFAHALGTVVLKRSDFNIGDKNINKSNGVLDEILVNFEIQAKKN
jgi:polyisoprenoid-binding protein YceI